MFRYLSDKDGDLYESIQEVLYSKRLPIIVVTFLHDSSSLPLPQVFHLCPREDFVFEKADKPSSENIVALSPTFSISKTTA
jgi:hypothetical protein